MSSANWSDLRLRVISGLVLAGLGLTAIWLGGSVFRGFMAICCGLMIWELGRMAFDKVIVTGVMALITVVSLFLSPGWDTYLTYAILSAPPIVFAAFATKIRVNVAAYAVMIIGAGLSMTFLRNDVGLISLLWVILVVVATDVAGYFVGRIVGGPKFWPSISPKKTWSGIVGGWIAASMIGAAFDLLLLWPLMIISIALSFASQMGDIAESSLKRRFGVKDSSQLIPGHGGFLDRFDGVISAGLLIGVVALLFPQGLQEMGLLTR